MVKAASAVSANGNVISKIVKTKEPSEPAVISIGPKKRKVKQIANANAIEIKSLFL